MSVATPVSIGAEEIVDPSGTAAVSEPEPVAGTPVRRFPLIPVYLRIKPLPVMAQPPDGKAKAVEATGIVVEPGLTWPVVWTRPLVSLAGALAPSVLSLAVSVYVVAVLFARVVKSFNCALLAAVRRSEEHTSE